MARGSRCSFPIHGRPWLVLCLLGSALAVSWATGPQGKVSSPEDVRKLCGHTRYPDLCADTLLSRQEVWFGQRLAGLVALVVERTRDEIMLSPAMHQVEVEGVQSTRGREAVVYCDELKEMSLVRLNQSLAAVNASPRKNEPDIQTWLSAVLTFQDSCKDAVGQFPSELSSKIAVRMDNLSALTSDALALALANRIPDDGRARTRRPRSSAEILPTWISEMHHEILGAGNIKVDAVVAQDGSGDYTSVAAAVTGAPSSGGRTVIFVKAGVYREKFNIGRAGLTLVGEGKDSTIITYNSSVFYGSSMANTATVAVTADLFMAKDIGFENTAGPHGQQALALRVASDHAVLYRCCLRGYQDTLYAHAFRHFYRECDIYGTIDFIFGNAAAVFQKCNLFLRLPKSGGSNAIMANGRANLAQNTGFVAQNCRILAALELCPVRHSVRSYLGRPWKLHSRAVFMESTIDDSIQPRGWLEWNGGFALQTLYFAEYLNSGPGAVTSGRITWPGFHVLKVDEASEFTVTSFIQGDVWLPLTGVIYDRGL